MGQQSLLHASPCPQHPGARQAWGASASPRLASCQLCGLTPVASPLSLSFFSSTRMGLTWSPVLRGCAEWGRWLVCGAHPGPGVGIAQYKGI